MKKTSLCILITGLLSACTDCGPQRELTIHLHVMRNRPLQIDSVYVLNALSRKGYSDFWELPISLHADSTTFVFVQQTKTDTLTLFYEREFRYKQNCGFIVNAHEPKDKRHYVTTFSSAKVSYGSYVSSEKYGPLEGPLSSRISVQITP